MADTSREAVERVKALCAEAVDYFVVMAGEGVVAKREDGLLISPEDALADQFKEGDCGNYSDVRERVISLFDGLLARCEKAERDEKIAQHNLQVVNEKWGESLKERDQLAAALATAKVRLAEAEKGIKPFANFADFLASETEGFNDSDELSLTTESGFLLQTFEVGDFRSARAYADKYKEKV